LTPVLAGGQVRMTIESVTKSRLAALSR